MDTQTLAKSTSAACLPLRRRRRGSPTLIFLRHYAEMIAAMMLGMLVLGAGLGLLLSLIRIDISLWRSDAPALMLLGMAFTMSAPMVPWMRYRGHGWAPTWEMVASMFVPSFGAIALLLSGAVEETSSLLAIEHTAMPLSMLAVMLLRGTEYSDPIMLDRRDKPRRPEHRKDAARRIVAASWASVPAGVRGRVFPQSLPTRTEG